MYNRKLTSDISLTEFLLYLFTGDCCTRTSINSVTYVKEKLLKVIEVMTNYGNRNIARQLYSLIVRLSANAK